MEQPQRLITRQPWSPLGFLNDRFWPILLKKSRRNFGPRKSVVDVEIWFAQKTELSWFLRSNAKIQRFLIYRKAALSEADFFNKIGQKQPLAE